MRYLRFLAVLPVFLFSGAVEPPKFTGEFTAKVIAITDGDTITVLREKESIKVRLDGIDAPERNQAFGSKARSNLSGLAGGRTVLVKTIELDKYGRTIARVIVDEKDLSEEQVREGYAWHYKKYSSDETLAELETTAREAKVGLWSEANPLEPWEFRDRRSAKEETPKAVASKTGKSRQQSESPESRSNFSSSPPVNSAPAERYWLNTASGTRHNIRCQYYNNTKKGRFCGPTEGKGCGTCGG